MNSRIERLPVFAVVRFDGDASDPFVGFSVKEILPTQEEAETEVSWLNKLNGSKGATYFWQTSRFYPQGRSKADV
jgi:hypothetical protein